MKGACLLHIVLISSIRLLTVMNTPSLNTLARNPLIQCLRHSVPTPVFLDNPQSAWSSLQFLDKPSCPSTFWLCERTPQPLSQLRSRDCRLPKIQRQFSYIDIFNTWFCFCHSCCHLKDLLPNQFVASFWVSPWQATPHCYSITGKNLAENASNLNEAWDQRLVPGSPGTARTVPACSPVLTAGSWGCGDRPCCTHCPSWDGAHLAPALHLVAQPPDIECCSPGLQELQLQPHALCFAGWLCDHRRSFRACIFLQVSVHQQRRIQSQKKAVGSGQEVEKKNLGAV